MFEVFDPTATESWKALGEQARAIKSKNINAFFDNDAARAEAWSIKCGGVMLDYSKNLLSNQALESLLSLVNESPLAQHRAAMFKGDPINRSEGRPVLHTALRADFAKLEASGQGAIAADIQSQKARIKAVSDKIRAGEWLGATGKPITSIINLGIGGSDLGPKMAYQALKEFHHPNLKCHFVSNVDGEVVRSLLKTLDAETTLMVISSKTFTTQETLLNANSAADWLRDQLGLENPFASSHVIGVTASPESAKKLGLPAENIIEFWDWVGGRYSLWSSIGLSIAIAVGYEHFEQMLAGARDMDEHFYTAPAQQNMPIIMALLGVWYTNFLNAETHAVIPYCERLFYFPFYLQQLDMESNGKSVTQDEGPVNYKTGPIIWGATGTNGQHSFFQLLHQGTHLIPVDFIGVIDDPMSSPEHHRVLLANMLAQSAALMTGKQSDALPAYRNYPGNRPSNVLLLDKLDPQTLGALIALYEHKVFVQGCLWNVNSFDQWGVELGKELATTLLAADTDRSSFDPSTQRLLSLVER